MNKYQGEKIQKTSFLDKAFMKTLAGAVRFGTTLLVENVEKLDPVLNPILNKEIQRTGGRCEFLLGMVVQHVGLLLDDGLNVFFSLSPSSPENEGLVRIGTEDVDYSPKFKIILTTKNPAVKLTPDICSRVTLVNFT
jgi:dynein heavy chain 1